MNITCAITNKHVNIAKSIYAVDLCDKNDKKIFSSAPSLGTHSTVHIQHDTLLDTFINPIGLFQNKGKKETILSFRDTGAHLAHRAIKNIPDQFVLDDMLYLGSWLTGSGSNTPELTSRINAAWKRWKCLGCDL